MCVVGCVGHVLLSNKKRRPWRVLLTDRKSTTHILGRAQKKIYFLQVYFRAGLRASSNHCFLVIPHINDGYKVSVCLNHTSESINISLFAVQHKHSVMWGVQSVMSWCIVPGFTCYYLLFKTGNFWTKYLDYIHVSRLTNRYLNHFHPNLHHF